MCTGSGCILLSLLKYSNDCVGVGVDISMEALAVAKKNGEKLGIKPEDIACPLRSKKLSLSCSSWHRRSSEKVKANLEERTPTTHFTMPSSRRILLLPLHKVEKFNEEEACIGHKI